MAPRKRGIGANPEERKAKRGRTAEKGKAPRGALLSLSGGKRLPRSEWRPYQRKGINEEEGSGGQLLPRPCINNEYK